MTEPRDQDTFSARRGRREAEAEPTPAEPTPAISEPTDQPSADGPDTAQGDTATADAEAADAEPTEPPDVGTWQPAIAEPPPEGEDAEPAQDARIELPPGEVQIKYLGTADLADIGEYKFRPGETVVVPSSVAEELLTWPNESFELVEAKE